jgi:hypothetical protein
MVDIGKNERKMLAPHEVYNWRVYFSAAVAAFAAVTIGYDVHSVKPLFLVVLPVAVAELLSALLTVCIHRSR